jgi:hypothetical protein
MGDRVRAEYAQHMGLRPVRVAWVEPHPVRAELAKFAEPPPTRAGSCAEVIMPEAIDFVLVVANIGVFLLLGRELVHRLR